MSYKTNLHTVRKRTNKLWLFQLPPIIFNFFFIRILTLIKILFKFLLKFNISLIFFFTAGVSTYYSYIYYGFKQSKGKLLFLRWLLLRLNILFCSSFTNFKFINIFKFAKRKKVRGFLLRTKYRLRIRYNERKRIKFSRVILWCFFGVYFRNVRLIMLALKLLLERAPFKRQWPQVRKFSKIIYALYSRYGSSIGGILVNISGKLNGSRRKRKAKLSWGKINTVSFNIPVLFSSGQARTIYGSIGIKVWISVDRRKHFRLGRYKEFQKLAYSKDADLYTKG